jgi:proline iminopeptidase
MKMIFAILLILISSHIFSQSLYVRTLGDNKSTPVIFLHGGPGYNSASFEGTTAQKLSEEGFFVIVYDRRGEGRSNDANAKFNFEETFEDLDSIYQQFGLSTASFIGHSFGGVVGTLFAEKYPEKVNSLILVSAPVALQETFKTIIKKSRDIYEQKNDAVGLNEVSLLEKMDTTSIYYASSSFMLAMKNGFYGTKNPTPESKIIRQKFVDDSLFHYSLQMTVPPSVGFAKNENFTTLDLTNSIKKLVGKVKVYGIYGKEDGLYSEEQVLKLQSTVGGSNLIYLENCSHSVFIDRQKEFIEAFKNWTK